MAGKISQLKDDLTGDYLYPVTTANSVYMEDNTVVEARIKSLENRRAETDASNILPTDAEKWKSKLGLNNVENPTLLYDMSSSDANINWGLTDGIVGGSTLNKPTFINYKKLRFYIAFAACQTQIIDLDMLKPVPNSTIHRRTGSAALCTDEPNSVYTSNIVYNVSTYNFWFELGFLKGTSYTVRNNNAGYHIYKIEGVN